MLRKEQETARKELIEKLMPFFQTELTVHYFDSGMRTTAQLVSDEKKEDNFTSLIATYKKDKTPEKKIQIEAERTAASLLGVSNCRKRKYKLFTEAQNPKEKLSEDSFEKLCDEVKEVVKDDSTETVLNYLITYSDLGKSPHTRELAKKFGIDPLLDTDDIVLEILKLPDEKIAAIFPSFAKLKKDEKELLRLAYPLMTICFGHLYFLEGGIKTLEAIAEALKSIPQEKRKELLELVFLVQFFDGVGSQGQVDCRGSLTCTEKFFQGYQLIRQTLFKLDNSFSETKDVQKASRLALDSYLAERAKLIELDVSTFKKKEHFECILRLACSLRIFDPALSKELQTQFYKLKSEHQELLSSQLNFSRDQGLNKFVRDPHYGIATASQNNSMRAFKDNKPEEGIALGLKAAICFSAMVQELNTNYESEVLDPKYPLSFGDLAFRGREPGFFDPSSFDPTLAKWALLQPVPDTTIKNIIVDVGHVLMRIDKSRRNTVYKAFNELSGKSFLEVSAILNEPSMQNHIFLYECGKMTSATFRTVIKEKLEMTDITDEQFDKAWCASIIDDAKVVNERLAYLEQLSKKGYKIFLLSNTNEIHLNCLKERFGANRWGKYFFKQYYSHQIGNCKPNPVVFQQIIQENQLKPTETAFFDDILPYDIAARKEGIFARQLTVNRKITDILPMIRAIDDAKERKVDVTSTSTLGIFALHKWKELVARKKENTQKISGIKLNQGST